MKSSEGNERSANKKRLICSLGGNQIYTSKKKEMARAERGSVDRGNSSLTKESNFRKDRSLPQGGSLNALAEKGSLF